ncbi:MAG: tetratricopeptide repeat protein, partial [Myxococcales bacterium]|nr:tetratricopeptide repeat protein [Myxococcales bacterium]
FKPDNVMVSEDRAGRVERVRVFDFGVVQETREAAFRQSSASMVLRTPQPDHADTVPTSERPGSSARSVLQSSSEEHGRSEEVSRSASRLRRVRARSSLPPQDGPAASGLSDSDSVHSEDDDSTNLTAAGALVGTPMYMAPEQYDQVADARSDQFSFCAALYEALYRKRPFTGESPSKIRDAKRAGEIRSPPKQHNVPAWLHKVIVRGMSPDPARRYPTMESLLAELERDRSRKPALLLAAGVLLVSAALGWALVGAQEDPCARVADRLADVWSAAHRERVQSAFRASGRPYAEATWAVVDAGLEEHAQQWTRQRVALCQAARDPLPAPQLDARTLCLEHRRQELGALVELLARADGAVVDHAAQAVAQLRPVAACHDIEALLARAAPPPPPGLANGAAALDVRLAEVEALEQTGQTATGLELAGAAVSDARALGHAPLLAEALYWQGLLRSRMSASRLGEAELREAATLGEESRNDEVVAMAFTELARVVGVDQERHAEGMLYAEFAAAALRRVGDDAGEVVRLGYLGHLLEGRGDLPTAYLAYSRALELARKTFPEEHPQVATALDDLAGMQLRRGELAAAEANYMRVLEIREATQGRGHPRVAEALGHLGRAAAAQGQTARARGLFEQALTICDGLGVCSAADRAEALINLGRVEQAEAHDGLAEVYYEEALGLLERIYGREHVRVAALLIDLGAIAARQGKPEVASGHYQRALTIQQALYEQDNPAMVAIHVHMGRLALSRGRPDEARALLEKAVAIHEKNDGFEDQALAGTLLDLAQIAREDRRMADAIALASRARQIFRRSHDEDHPDVVRATHTLARAYIGGADPIAAEVLLEASQTAQTAVSPPAATIHETRFLLAQALAARSGPDALARRLRAQSLAADALAAVRADPGRAALVAEIEAWLRESGR